MLGRLRDTKASSADLILDRNTTMRHPDADTSPNACIEASDLSFAQAHTRRRNLLRERHSSWRASRHGKITVDTSYANLPSTERLTDSGYGSAILADKGDPVSFVAGSSDFNESPMSSPNSFGNAMRNSEDLVIEKTRQSLDSPERRKGGLLHRIHSLRHRSQGSRG